MKIILLFMPIVLFSLSTLANDGFYQGAGATLTPVENLSMRVIKEELEITPLKSAICYSIDISKSSYDDKGELKDSAYGYIGKSKKCPNEVINFETLNVRWHAKAIYEVEALADQNGVQIGFPVPTWALPKENSEGRVDVLVPCVANFSTSIDETEVKDLSLKDVPVKNANGKTSAKESLTPAFVWKSNFKKGKRYQLKTEYDFGIDYSNGMYEGTDYPKGSILWFDRRTLAQVRYGGGPSFQNEKIIYYLQPIRLWGGGTPESISVKVATHDSIPVYYLTPLNSGIDCIDTKAIYFTWKNAFPPQDLSISYPVTFYTKKGEKFNYTPIQQQEEYDAWADLIGNLSNAKRSDGRIPRVKMTCALESELLKNLPKKSYFHGWVKDGVQPKCVESCEF